MNANPRLLRFAFALFGFLAATAFAAGGAPDLPAGQPVDPDYKLADEAIQAKDWNAAVAAASRLRERDPKNADAYNLLGFAERNRGNLELAFRLYEQALKLNPAHRGAHEYIGEAYLISNNLAKAEEHLARLDRLCFFGCEEYTDLKKKIAAFKAKSK